MKFTRICTLLAAKRTYDAGQSFKEIAKAAGVPPATVYRWLKQFN